MIVFGHNNFRLRSFSPDELGIHELYDQGTIEVRQRYAHVFWIPIFPIGRIWGLRRADGQLYVIHPELETRIKQLARVPKISFLSFIGIIIILAIAVIGGISSMVQEMQMKEFTAKIYHDNYQKKIDKIEHPKVNDFYEFTMYGKKFDDVIFRVDSVAGDRILLTSPFNDDPYENGFILDEKHAKDYFNDTTVYENKFWTQKAELKNCTIEDLNDPEFRGSVIKSMDPGSKFAVNGVLRPGEEY